MLRLVLLIAAVLLLVWMLRGIGRGGRKEPPPAGGAARRTDALETTAMVACAHCGVHLPSSDAVEARGLHFCGEPHRIEFERRQAP